MKCLTVPNLPNWNLDDIKREMRNSPVIFVSWHCQVSRPMCDCDPSVCRRAAFSPPLSPSFQRPIMHSLALPTARPRNRRRRQWPANPFVIRRSAKRPLPVTEDGPLANVRAAQSHLLSLLIVGHGMRTRKKVCRKEMAKLHSTSLLLWIPVKEDTFLAIYKYSIVL